MENIPQEQLTKVEHLAQQLKEYEILKQLGIGGMGIVFLAKHRLTDRLEVLKILRPDLASRPKLKVRFLREVKLAAMLDHPHVVKTYTAVQNGPLLGLVLEYVDGLNLEAIVKRGGPMRIATAISVIQQAASGLAHAASCGLIHRDIKPSNILVRRVGNQLQAKITDFGLSKAEEDETENATDLTVAGRFLGTPDYMAPEQGLDASQATTVSDIYGLGCTMFFALAGRPPYKGANALAVLNAHLTQPVPDIRTYRSDVPEPLAELLTSMLQKDPKRRCQSAQEVVECLQRIATSGIANSAASPTTSVEAVATAPASTVAGETVGESEDTRTQEYAQPHQAHSQLAELGLSPSRSQAAKGKPRKRKSNLAWSTLLQVLIPIGFLSFAYFYFRPAASQDAVGTLRLVQLTPGTSIEIDGLAKIEAARISADNGDIKLGVGQHTVRILQGDRELAKRTIEIKPNSTLELSSSLTGALPAPQPDHGNPFENVMPPTMPPTTMPRSGPDNFKKNPPLVSDAHSSPTNETGRDANTNQPNQSRPSSTTSSASDTTSARQPWPPAENSLAERDPIQPSDAEPIVDQRSNWQVKLDRSLPALVRPASALSIIAHDLIGNGNPLLAVIAPEIHAWDATTGAELKRSFPMARLRRVDVANSEQRILYIDRYYCEVWDLNKGKYERTLKPLNNMDVEREYGISGDGRMLAACGYDHQYTRWNIQTKEKVIELSAKQPMDANQVKAIQFTPRLDTVIMLGHDGSMMSWSSANGTTQGRVDASTSKVIGMHVNAAQVKLICVHDNGKLCVYSLPFLQLEKEVQLPIVDVQVSAMSNKVLLCSDRQANACAVDISVPADIGLLKLKETKADERPKNVMATSAAISVDSKIGAVALGDGTIHILTIKRGKN